MDMTQSINKASRACAGFTWDGMIHKITPKQWDAMLAVHCTAPFRLIQASTQRLPVPGSSLWQSAQGMLAWRGAAWQPHRVSVCGCAWRREGVRMRGRDRRCSSARAPAPHGSRSAWQTPAVWQGRLRDVGMRADSCSNARAGAGGRPGDARGGQARAGCRRGGALAVHHQRLVHLGHARQCGPGQLQHGARCRPVAASRAAIMAVPPQGCWQCGTGGATDRASHWPAACLMLAGIAGRC